MKPKGKGQLNGFLDAGSHLQGELRFEDTFRVDGRMSGKVESKGDLFVGEQGLVEGEVQVGRLFVSGQLDAAVRAAERIEIAAGARVRGELSTPCLVIEEGAFFEGSAKMVDPPGEPLHARVAPLRRE
jgi:cytoskeletal protein CcmA (bactofilin family)